MSNSISQLVDGLTNAELPIVIAVALLTLFALIVGLRVYVAGRSGGRSPRKLTFRGLAGAIGGSLWALPVLFVLGCFLVRSADELEGRPPREMPETITSVKALPDGAEVPDWVRQRRQSVDDDHRFVVVSSEFQPSKADADREVLDKTMAVVAYDLEQSHGRRLGRFHLPEDQLRTNNVRAQFVESKLIESENVSKPDEPHTFQVHRVHWQLELSPATRSELAGTWQRQVQTNRLWMLGGLACLLTLIFAVVTAYLRLDTRTSGRYRTRLKLASLALIIAGGLAATVLIPPTTGRPAPPVSRSV